MEMRQCHHSRNRSKALGWRSEVKEQQHITPLTATCNIIITTTTPIRGTGSMVIRGMVKTESLGSLWEGVMGFVRVSRCSLGHRHQYWVAPSGSAWHGPAVCVPTTAERWGPSQGDEEGELRGGRGDKGAKAVRDNSTTAKETSILKVRWNRFNMCCPHALQHNCADKSIILTLVSRSVFVCACSLTNCAMAVGVQLPEIKKNLPCGHIVIVTVGRAMNSAVIYFTDVCVCVCACPHSCKIQITKLLILSQKECMFVMSHHFSALDPQRQRTVWASRHELWLRLEFGLDED